LEAVLGEEGQEEVEGVRIGGMERSAGRAATATPAFAARIGGQGGRREGRVWGGCGAGWDGSRGGASGAGVGVVYSGEGDGFGWVVVGLGKR